MIRLLKYDLVGFLIASRIPSLFIIGATQYLTLIFLVADFEGKEQLIYSLRFFLVVASTLLVAAAAYINNDYYDQKIDMINRPDRVVVGTLFRRRLAILAHFLLTLTGIGLGLLVKFEVGLVHLFSAFLLWYYSNRLRRLPVLGNLVIAFSSGLTLLLIPVYLGRSEPLVFVYAVFAICIILIREVIKDLEDVKGDQRFGVQTIPVRWGIRGTKAFIGLVILAGGGFLVSFLILIDNWILRYYFLGLVPIFSWFIYKLASADTLREYSILRRFTNVIIFTGLISMMILEL